jgi:hypothetical protein
MAGSLGSLNVLLSADTTQFSSAMEKASFTAERNLKRIGVAAKLSLAALSAAFIANTKDALVFADTIGKMADKLGVTSEQMSKLAYAAKMSDIGVEELSGAMRKMYVSAYSGASAFEALQVKVKDANGIMRNGGDILLDLADRFQAMPNGVGKASAAIQIFGKTGTDMIPLLNLGSKGIAEFASEAKKLGVVVSAESAKNAEAVDDWMKKFMEGAKGVSMRFIDAVASIANGYKLVTMSSEEYGKSIEDHKKMLDEQTSASKNSTQAVAEQALAFEKASEAAEKHAQMIEDGLKLKDEMMTAQEKYNTDLEYYNTLLEGSAISQETFDRASASAAETLKKANQLTVKQTDDTDRLNDVSRDLGFTFSSAFENAIVEGKKFSEVLVGLAKDIERIILRQAVTTPLANALSAGISSWMSPGTSLGSQTAAFGGGTAPYSGPASGSAFTVASKHGNAFQAFANGGVINSPMTFPMTGGKTGLAGEAGKEAILPLTRTSSGDLGVKAAGGGGVQVNVYAPEGSKVTQDQQQDGGMEKINIYIDEAVAGNVSKPGSKTFRALKGTFGIGQTLAKR